MSIPSSGGASVDLSGIEASLFSLSTDMASGKYQPVGSVVKAPGALSGPFQPLRGQLLKRADYAELFDAVLWSDPFNMVERTISGAGYFYAIDYNDGNWVGISSGNKIYQGTSISSMIQRQSGNSTLRAFAYKPGTDNWVVVGTAGNSYYSSDSISWILNDLPVSIPFYSVIYDQNVDKFKAFTVNSEIYCFEMTPGVWTWSEKTSSNPTGGYFTNVVYVPELGSSGRIVAVGGSSSASIWTSDDGGATWIDRNPPTALLTDAKPLYTVDWDGTTLICAGSAPADLPAIMYKSTDGGITWEEISGAINTQNDSGSWQSIQTLRYINELGVWFALTNSTPEVIQISKTGVGGWRTIPTHVDHTNVSLAAYGQGIGYEEGSQEIAFIDSTSTKIYNGLRNYELDLLFDLPDIPIDSEGLVSNIRVI